MGGGNAQKSKMARERNAEKNKGSKGSQLEANKKAMNIQLITSNISSTQCKICMQTFICTTSEAKCKEHAEARHPKNELVQCFPHLKN
ncbi:hypothetical protein HU200_037432 [Digitaria exilis]|uniref:Uncharacterized protein n=1 Tax=Digitaria exilis TaxID=1010633 RepID=A0A835BQJ1_9POAL|nr:hypothetical protein HU200_037432 [Digitaria exilis]